MSKAERRKTKWKNDYARSRVTKTLKEKKHKKRHPKDVQTPENAKRAQVEGDRRKQREAVQASLARVKNADSPRKHRREHAE